MHQRTLTVIVRGVGYIGSSIAHRLFLKGYAVVLHDVPTPTTTRRGMAFADAVFDGPAVLNEVHATRAHDLRRVTEAVAAWRAIPIYVRDLGPLLSDVHPWVLVDARMWKHSQPEVQLGLAEFTVALGPSLIAGRHADVVVETSWDHVGEVITQGSSLALAGERRDLGGHARERYVYAVRWHLSDEASDRRSGPSRTGGCRDWLDGAHRAA